MFMKGAHMKPMFLYQKTFHRKKRTEYYLNSLTFLSLRTILTTLVTYRVMGCNNKLMYMTI